MMIYDVYRSGPGLPPAPRCWDARSFSFAMSRPVIISLSVTQPIKKFNVDPNSAAPFIQSHVYYEQRVGPSIIFIQQTNNMLKAHVSINKKRRETTLFYLFHPEVAHYLFIFLNRLNYPHIIEIYRGNIIFYFV